MPRHVHGGIQRRDARAQFVFSPLCQPKLRQQARESIKLRASVTVPYAAASPIVSIAEPRFHVACPKMECVVCLSPVTAWCRWSISMLWCVTFRSVPWCDVLSHLCRSTIGAYGALKQSSHGALVRMRPFPHGFPHPMGEQKEEARATWRAPHHSASLHLPAASASPDEGV
jgi:hypothetical protein